MTRPNQVYSVRTSGAYRQSRPALRDQSARSPKVRYLLTEMSLTHCALSGDARAVAVEAISSPAHRTQGHDNWLEADGRAPATCRTSADGAKAQFPPAPGKP